MMPDPQDAAIDWALRHIEGTMDAPALAAFTRWLEQNPAHPQAFDRAMASWALLEAPRFEPEILALRSEALAALQNAQRRRWRLPGHWPQSLSSRLALAASLLLLAAGGLYLHLAPTHYHTGIGERRVVALADGSLLAMDAQTSVSVNYRADGRHLTLEQGRAGFTVARDPLHPFSVASHGSMVVATGTQFSVEWLAGQTRVVLYEGHVAVLRQNAGTLNLVADHADAQLTPGREMVLDGNAPALVHDLADPHAQRAWEQGQIDAADEPLGVVAARMNRYLPGPPVQVAQDAKALKISGVFNAGDVDAFVGGVTQVFPVTAHKQADGSFCLARQSNSSRACD